jgi:hypothetical protein
MIMFSKVLHAASAAALVLMLAGCANDRPYSDDGSLAYDYGYSPFEGFYGGDWGPAYYDGGSYHGHWHAWRGGEDWHGSHFATHSFGGVPGGGTRLGFADMHGGGFGGFHGGGFGGQGGGFGGHGGGGRA